MPNRFKSRHLTIGTICAIALGFGGCATTGTPTAAQHNEVVAVVNQLFEAMRTKDEAAMRSAIADEIAMTSVDAQRGARTTFGSPDAFVNSILSAQGELIERMWDAEVRIDGDLATLWAPYDFHIEGTFSHCGYDAFQLVRGPDGWRVVSVAFTRQTEGCE